MTHSSKLVAILVLILMAMTPCRAQTAATDETTRLIVGFAQAGTPQAQPTQHVFADLYFSRPLPVSKLALWGDIRLASLPRPINSTALNVAADVAKTVLTTPLYQLAQSGEFVAGLEYELLSAAPGKTRVAAIAAFGASAPMTFSPSQNRFPRQYWGGLRFARNGATPHVLDVTAGQNEVITGGTLHGPVIRFESEYGMADTKAGTVYLLGEIQLAGARGAPQSDVYRLGIGFDFLRMLKMLKPLGIN